MKTKQRKRLNTEVSSASSQTATEASCSVLMLTSLCDMRVCVYVLQDVCVCVICDGAMREVHIGPPEVYLLGIYSMMIITI